MENCTVVPGCREPVTFVLLDPAEAHQGGDGSLMNTCDRHLAEACCKAAPDPMWGQVALVVRYDT